MALSAALAASLSACGGGSSSSAEDEATGRFPVEVVRAEFPTKQRLGQTSLLELAVRNDGERTVPALAVTMTLAGEEGENASLPFTVRDPQPDLAQPDRPVWALAYQYPKLRGSSEPAGSSIANQKTFVFGPLEADEQIDAIWKLSAVRTGKYTVLYEIDAGTGGEAKAVTNGDAKPGGSFTVEITEETPDVIVTDTGRVVEKRENGKGKRKGAGKGD